MFLEEESLEARWMVDRRTRFRLVIDWFASGDILGLTKAPLMETALIFSRLLKGILDLFLALLKGGLSGSIVFFETEKVSVRF